MNGAGDVHRSENGEDIGLQKSDEQLECSEKNQHEKWKYSERYQKELLSTSLKQCLGEEGKDHKQ